jgi:peptide/nickel transport system substrate-binding protein/oligopeptide transport system substrate-binding protein
VSKWRGSNAAPQLRIALPAGAGADQLYVKLAADLKLVGLAAVRVGWADRADLRLIDAVASYPRAAWYFNQFNCANQRGLCSSEADKLFAEAADAPDPAKRTELMAQAEARLDEADVFIPFGPPVRWSLVRSRLAGFAANPLGYHPLMSLALLPK